MLGPVAHTSYNFGASDCRGWFWQCCGCTNYSSTICTLKKTDRIAGSALADW